MEYPPFNSNSKAISLASKDSYLCAYDIVWSFDYAIVGDNNTEAGFTVFLMANKDGLSANDNGIGLGLSGGNGGIDLGYSGLSSTNLPYSINPGVSGAVLAVGFDTTGLFAASAFSGNYIRDGVSPVNIHKNSVVMRGGAPYYRYSDFNYNVPLSSLNSTFSIVESGAIFKTVRARLGKVGRTLYIDYRNNPYEDFKPIFEKDITLSIPVSSYAYAGVSFATPISSSSLQTIGNIYIKNFHVEGLTGPQLCPPCYLSLPPIPPLDTGCTIFPCVTSLPLTGAPPLNEPPLPVINYPINLSAQDNIGININLIGGCAKGLDTCGEYSCINIAYLPDLYNFGYKLKIIQNNIILTRVSYFTYADILSTNIIQLSNCNLGWSLSTYSYVLNNFSDTPNGLYTGLTSLSVIYINE